jgi:hypothetical protein
MRARQAAQKLNQALASGSALLGYTEFSSGKLPLSSEA